MLRRRLSPLRKFAAAEYTVAVKPPLGVAALTAAVAPATALRPRGVGFLALEVLLAGAAFLAAGLFLLEGGVGFDLAAGCGTKKMKF